MEQLISRQAAINEANAWLLDCLQVNKQDRSCGLIRRLEDLPSVEPVDYGYLADWFINSVGNEEPVWTEEHIDELMEDFYIIPKEKR